MQFRINENKSFRKGSDGRPLTRNTGVGDLVVNYGVTSFKRDKYPRQYINMVY